MRKGLIAILILILMVIILLEPSTCIEGATLGLLLWFQKVLPSLLPFIILINLLCLLGIIFKLSIPITPITKKLLNLSGSSFLIFLLGLISGYPMGAKLTKSSLEAGEISLDEAVKTLCFTCNCGPLFIVGTIGTLMLGDLQLGYFLLLVHILSAFIMLLLSRFHSISPLKITKHTQQTTSKISFSSAFTCSIQNAMDTIVYVGGYIIFFSMLMQLLSTSPLYNKFSALLAHILHIDPHSLHTFFLSLLEFSTGSATLINSLPQNILLLALLSALIAFGGICVLFQTQYMIQGSKLSITPYLCAKILQAILAFLLTFNLFPIWNHFSNHIPLMFSPFWLFALILVVISIAIFYKNLTKLQ